MVFARVTDVFDVVTISVWPPWEHNGHKGTLVRIHGLSNPKGGVIYRNIAQCKLRFLIVGCIVEIVNMHRQLDGMLECDVHYTGRNLTEHLHEYASPPASTKTGENSFRPLATVLNFDEKHAGNSSAIGPESHNT